MPQSSSSPTPISALLSRIASTDPATKTWTCPQCGEIPAKELRQAPGYYIRQACPCEQRRREQMTWTPPHTEPGATCYTWVGQDWADLALREKTFATFERALQPEACEIAQTFAREPHGVLALFGGYGVGKTHLLAAIANALEASGKSCLYVSAVVLFEVLQERLQQGRAYHELLKRAIQTPLLLIDDLDKPKPSEFREAIYYLLIDKRTLAGRPLALSSNAAPPALERWIGKAARSRLLMDLSPVDMRGQDYRLGTGKPRKPKEPGLSE